MIRDVIGLKGDKSCERRRKGSEGTALWFERNAAVAVVCYVMRDGKPMIDCEAVEEGYEFCNKLIERYVWLGTTMQHWCFDFWNGKNQGQRHHQT